MKGAIRNKQDKDGNKVKILAFKQYLIEQMRILGETSMEKELGMMDTFMSNA